MCHVGRKKVACCRHLCTELRLRRCFRFYTRFTVREGKARWVMAACGAKLQSSNPDKGPRSALDKQPSSSFPPAAAHGALGPLAGDMAFPGTGYNQWMRERRAKGDTLPLLCCLGFLCTVLWRNGRFLPTPYLLYFATMIAVAVSLLAWQHSGGASYLQWRDWVHAAIRLDAFFNPAQLYLVQLSWAADAPPSRLAALPLIILNSGTVQLFVLSFVHYVNFPCQLLLQSLCAARVVVVVLTEGWQEAQFAQHPNTQQGLHSLFEWFEGAVGPFSWLPLGPPKGRPSVENNRVIVMVVVGFGLLAPLALQAAAELRTYRAFCRQQQQLQVAPRRQVARDVAADRLLDRCNAALLPVLGQLSASPFVLLLLSIALWDALASICL